MTPISPGTARRLGLRKPQPLAAYRQRWALGISMADIEEAAPDNLKALREASKVNWTEEWRYTEVLNIAPYRL